MPRIPQDEIDRLKVEVSVQRLAEGKGIELRPHGGGNLIGRCPFHDDRTPSLVITPGKNLWHCLGACQAGGSPIDWVMRAEGVSFRHAVEILRELFGRGPDAPAGAGALAPRPGGRLLPPPVAAEADDAAALAQVVDYYVETLKRTPAALAYLQRRGIDHPEALSAFRIGFADRSLGLRLPPKQIKAGAEMRGKLQRLGVMRESGHEHFTGSIIFPLLGSVGEITGMYGRKINDDLRPGTAYHLYLPGPHRGLWNPDAFTAGGGEVIVCEAIIDALTFWCAGFRNVTAAYGVEGFTPDHWAALRAAQVHSVFIAYDRDEAGNTAAAKLADELIAAGISAYRVQFPPGMDANEYARKVTPPDKSLGVALRGAQWLGRGSAPARHLSVPALSQAAPVPADAGTAHASAVIADAPTQEPAPAPMPAAPAPAAAAVAAVTAPALASPAAAGPAAPAAERRGEDVVVTLGEREYRVRGLGKNLAFDVLRINLRVRVGDAYHIDTLDLYQAKARTVFINAAAEATQQKPETIAKDIGKLLMALEELQEQQIAEALKPKGPQPVTIPDDEAAAALAWLQSPNLLDRILADFAACGVVGEEINKLAGYLAAVSRKLDEPLAILIQSSSAAGKSSLMEAVLALIPEEERVQYSAMTGQSLYYMGDANLAHKILAIAEEEGASRASYALKLLQSEGRLTIASTGKDPQSGRLVTHDYTVEGPVMIFMTTTAVDIDEELMNRCIVLTVDEGAEQTHAIHQVQRSRQTLAGQLTKRSRDHVRKLHQNAQRLIRSLMVVNPFAERLTFLHHRTRLRRDHVKYLTLIRSVALLHQHQRPVHTVQHHGQSVPYIEVIPADIAVANRIAHAVLGRSLDELSPPTRRFLMDVHGLVTATAQRKQIDRADVRLTRREIGVATGWTMTQVGVHLGRLIELEYLIQHQGGRGQQCVYELMYDGEGQDGATFLPGLVDPTTLTVPSYDANLSASGPNLSVSSLNLSEPKRPQNVGKTVGYRSDLSADSSSKNQSTDQEEATKIKIFTLPGVCAEVLDRNRNAAAVAV